MSQKPGGMIEVKAPQVGQAPAAEMDAGKLKVSTRQGMSMVTPTNKVAELEAENTESGDVDFADEASVTLDKMSQKPGGMIEVKAPQVGQAPAAEMDAGKLKVSTRQGMSMVTPTNKVAELEAENTESGDVDFADEASVTLDKMSQKPGLLTQVEAKNIAEAKKSSSINTGELRLSAGAGIKLTGTSNSADSLEASDTESGGVEYTNKGSMSLGKVSAPGKGKVSIDLTDSQAKATATGPISGSKVSLSADQMSLAGGSVTSKTATLAPVTASQPLSLGASQPSTLSLSQPDMAAVNAKKLLIGAPKAGPITVSAPIAPAGVGTLTLETPGRIEGSGGGSLTVSALALIDTEAVPAAAWTITPSSIAQGAGQPVSYSGVTSLAVTGGGKFGVTASPVTKESLAGTKKSPNGELDYDAQGRPVSGSPSAPTGTIASPGVKPVKFKEIATLNIANRG